MSGPLEHIALCPPCVVQGFGVPGRASVWVSGQGSPGVCDPQRCSSRCGKPRPSTLCPSPRTTGEPTTGRTDRDFVSDVSEKEQRWGAKAMPGSGHQEHIKEKELEMGPKASHTYRGKFGVEQDRMDKSAVGLEYQSKLSKCCLQVDSIWGFGGKFGVQLARVDQKHSAKLSRSWAMIVFSRTVTSVWKRPKCSSVRGEVQSVDTPQGTALPLLPATFSCRRPRTDSSVCVSSFPALMLQVIIQRPEYDKDILNSMRSLICLKLLYGP
ncbi:uncharacterized protein LOC122432092 isoform X2 [Cervus canadensis]|uniref:uncharacterized protein LOC122432092 isoform X2 n=1 Tax=Cervus canadensis TaxID=1574408 RepID=UPI001CA30C4F|nr:uncharacterized protein LOC122432092 isoform X2 [Cervus canadensis]